LGRLRNWDDQESWREFFDSYWRLIYGVAVRYGLTDSEAEDVVQETVLSVAKKMDTFRYDPAVCSFKGWLRHVTHLRILDQLRKRGRWGLHAGQPATNTSGASELESLPDSAPSPLETLWDEEWSHHIVESAMERVKPHVSPVHYQIYYLHVVKQLPAGKVASMLAVARAQVYLVKHRLGGMVTQEIKRLEAMELNG
jgi:RNA polymerase sigma factor (sigma-70 family)